MNRDIARRLAALEAKLQPAEEPIWNVWQTALSRDEYQLVFTLHARGATHAGEPEQPRTWHDDWPAWKLLCDDARELALLAAIEGKAKQAGQELWHHLLDLSL